MKYISWNVNGIRAWKDKPETLLFIKEQDSDALCLQEIKIDKEVALKLTTDTSLKKETDFVQTFPQYPFEYWNSAEKKGYSGTAIFSKIKALSITYGIGHVLDNEGRVITAEFDNHYLVTVYTPNSKDDLSRLDIRYNEWDKDFLDHIKKLEEKKPVIACGDLNVAHKEIDIARASANKTTTTKPGSPGFTNKERERFGDFLEAGLIDSFRHLYSEKIQYSWWSYRGGARDRNVGWRIDYFLTSKSIKEQIVDAVIYDQTKGSDHCPVGIILK
jgi:exodeoxyribonuclease-3